MKALHYSGGIDSLACLELLKREQDLVVITALTDGAYADKEAYLDKVAKHYHYIRFVRVYQNRYLNIYGHPVDVVPIKFTAVGSIIHDTQIKYQSVFECCNRGLWVPVQMMTEKLGCDTVYRGQRAEDPMKAPIRDGHVENGITYHFPLQEWTREQVKAFVKEHVPHLVPEYYEREQSSRDCWDCTAYLHENLDRIRNLPKEQYIKVSDILTEWRKDVNDETRW